MVILIISDQRERKPLIDISREFAKIRIDDRPVVRKFLKILDKAEYHSPEDVLDRFGHLTDIHCLSSGCKAALLTVFRPYMITDLAECGENARDAILNFSPGGIILTSPFLTAVGYDDPACDVCCNGYRFRNLLELNEYLTRWYPFSMDRMGSNTSEVSTVHGEAEATCFPIAGSGVSE